MENRNSLKKILFPEVKYAIGRKMIALILVVAFYTAGYLGLNYYTIGSLKFYDVSMAWEAHIPFYEIFVFAYAFVYVLVIILILAINDDKFMNQAVKAYLLNSCIHFIIFYFFPVRMELRPEVIPDGTFVTEFAAFWFWLDKPTTLFPSAHVSMSFLSAFFTYRINKKLGWFCIVCAAIVSVSVLLMKQHYVADVVAGFILCCFVFYLFDPKKKLKQDEPEPQPETGQ